MEINGAYTQLIIEVQNDLYRVARARLDIEDDICDAIQETMIKAYENLKKLKNDQYFKTWIIRILINECNNIYRRKNRQLNIFQKSTNNYQTIEDEAIDRSDTKLIIEEMLGKLKYEERLLITLYYNSQLSIKEISKLLNCNTNTVKSRLSRTKNKLKNIYQEVLSDGQKR